MADFGITSDGSRTFFLNGELDMATVPIMDLAIVDAVGRGGPISMDLTDITFLDSTGLGCDPEGCEGPPFRLHRPPRCARRGQQSHSADGRGQGGEHPCHPLHPRRPSLRGLAVADEDGAGGGTEARPQAICARRSRSRDEVGLPSVAGRGRETVAPLRRALGATGGRQWHDVGVSAGVARPRRGEVTAVGSATPRVTRSARRQHGYIATCSACRR